MIFCMTVAEPDPDADAALEDCIARIAGGDKDALADLYSRTRPAVYGLSLIHILMITVRLPMRRLPSVMNSWTDIRGSASSPAG